MSNIDNLQSLGIDNIQSLRAWEPPDTSKDLISGGVLAPGCNMLYFGGTGNWKTMFSMYTAFCLGTGSKWLGYNTRPCVVLKYQIELTKAEDRKRILKYADNMFTVTHNADISYPPNVHFKSSQGIKLDSASGVASLKRDLDALCQVYPKANIVLILDPLFKLISGNPNNPQDMLRVLDNVEYLTKEKGIATIICHHKRKSFVDSRGNMVNLGIEDSGNSGKLEDWCDTAIQSRLLDPRPKGDATTVQLDFLKHRVAESAIPSFEVKWDRNTLIPHWRILNPQDKDDEEINIR